MELHQEMRANPDVECLGQMRGLQPRRYAADPRNVDLHDRARAPLKIVAELRGAIEAFADRDRNARRSRKARVAVDVVRRQRLLEPADVGYLVKSRAPDRLVDGKGLVGVG